MARERYRGKEQDGEREMDEVIEEEISSEK